MIVTVTASNPPQIQYVMHFLGFGDLNLVETLRAISGKLRRLLPKAVSHGGDH